MPQSPERANLKRAASHPANGWTAGPCPQAWRRAVEHLVEQVHAWEFEGGPVWRAQTPVPETDAFSWLEANPQGSRMYWRDRSGNTERAGLDIAWQRIAEGPAGVEGLLEESRQLAASYNLQIQCAFSFDGQPGEAEWSGFPAGVASIPALELIRQGEELHLAVTLIAHTHRDWMHGKTRQIERLRALHPGGEPPLWPTHVVERSNDQDYIECRRRIGRILDEIRAGRLHKAVLARQVVLQFNRHLPAFTTLRRWSEITGGSYCFALQWGERIFMGCSPERLFRRQGDFVQTESLAGTVRRGETPAEDEQLEQALREDPKLIREHAWVTRYIQGELEALTHAVEAPDQANVLKLDRIQHRQLPIEATLRPGVGDGQLLQALHPTPAVCGFPRDRARNLLAQEEVFQRGWYSGVVGVVAPQASELAVAIRSALVHGDRAWCYSGVGIVEGSEADAEWQELEAKIESFLAAVET